MSDTPRVSVVIPHFNYGPFVTEAVESALAQTGPSVEVVLVDDGSTDPAARQVIQGLRRERLTVIHQENTGCAGALNTAIRHARGEFILPLGADDRLCGDFARQAVDAFDHTPEARIVACRVEFFGAKTGPMVLPPYSLEGMLRRNLITASSVFRRADWERVGGFCREVLLHEDYDFWLSLLELGGAVIQLDLVGLHYRKHSTWRPSKSHRARRTKEALAYRQIRERHRDLYSAHPGVLLDWVAELDLDRVNRLDSRLGSRLSRWFKETLRRG